MESAATGGAAHPPGACDPPQNCGGYMSLVGRWEETKFPAGINLVQTMAPGWRQIESEVALDLITIPAVSALGQPPPRRSTNLGLEGCSGRAGTSIGESQTDNSKTFGGVPQNRQLPVGTKAKMRKGTDATLILPKKK